jgi:hypothetical protein
MQTLLYPANGRADMTKVKFKIATLFKPLCDRARPVGRIRIGRL